MAGTSVLKLVVDDKQYEASLKNARQGMLSLQESLQAAGKTFSDVDGKVVEYARAIGQMNTVSKTAKGRIGEMSQTFVELKSQYQKMTDAEKQSPLGQAMSKSLEELKTRTLDAKKELADINKELNETGKESTETGGFLGQLSDKFTLNVDAIKLFNIGLQAADGALSVAKDAFFASESTVDEWGRVMDSSKSLYEGFLTALNTGDISGYLSRIDSIVQAARSAYNELDRLGTMKTIQAPQISAQQTENERMRMMIQTGRYIAPVDGRKASMQNGQLLTPDQIKRIEQQLQGGMQKVVTLVGNEVAQTGRAIDAVYNRQAQELGMSLKEFRKGTSSMAEFDKRMAGYDQYQKWREQHTTIDLQSGRETVARGNPYEQFAKWGTFRVDGNRYNDLVKLIQQRDQQAGQAYSMQSQAYRTMNRAEGITLKGIMGGGGSGGGKVEITYAADSIAAQSALVSELNKKFNESGEAVRNGMIPQLVEAEQRLKAMRDNATLLKEQAQGKLLGGDVQTTDLGNVVGIPDIGNGLSDDMMEYIKNLNKGGKDVSKSWTIAANAIKGVGSAMSGLKNPAIDIMNTIGQAIATVALAYAQTLAKDASSKSNIFAFIAAAAASTVSMATTIAAIHSSTGYAEGGVIKGNSYSGDNVGGLVDGSQLVGLNAGEVVLTKAMQSNLANTLEGNGIGNLNLRGVLQGENIIISVDRTLRRMGRGELMTWKG